MALRCPFHCRLPSPCLPITLADPPAGCRAAWQERGVGGESLQYREEIDDRLCRDLSPLAGRARGVLGGSRRGDRLGEALGPGARRQPAALLPLVRRRAAQYLLECARPSCRGGARRAARADLG